MQSTRILSKLGKKAFAFRRSFGGYSVNPALTSHMYLRYATASVVTSAIFTGLLWNAKASSKLSSDDKEGDFTEVKKPEVLPLPLYYEDVKRLKQQWNNEDEGVTADTLVARASELADKYEKTHYVFIHGQTSAMTPVIYFINGLIKKQGIPKSHFFKHIRNLQNISPEDIKQIIKQIQEGILDDHAVEARSLVISADADFRRRSEGESAQYFLRRNYSVMHEFRKLLESNVVAGQIISDDALDEITSICDKLYKERKYTCGNLFVICIPKNMLQNANESQLLAYSAHPYGKKYDRHPEKTDVDILDELRNNMCNFSDVEKKSPQFRLVIPELRPENGVLTFMLTAMPKQKRKDIKAKVNDSLNNTKHLNYGYRPLLR